ncbi:hypothetical protein BDW22DRAFT_967250 [Trametopsis cervina]|nr:hypothetical protein BDW22DRAFT_967250 [Trametopsis cervina]
MASHTVAHHNGLVTVRSRAAAPTCACLSLRDCIRHSAFCPSQKPQGPCVCVYRISSPYHHDARNPSCTNANEHPSTDIAMDRTDKQQLSSSHPLATLRKVFSKPRALAYARADSTPVSASTSTSHDNPGPSGRTTSVPSSLSESTLYDTQTHTRTTRNQHSTPVHPASTQHLPSELVFAVLRYVLPPAHTHAAAFPSDPRALYAGLASTSDFRGALRRAQASLRAATLVCRAWCLPATELLYACPFLDSTTSVLALQRTLARELILGKLVKTMWVFNAESGAKGAAGRCADLAGIRKRKARKKVQADFIGALRALTSLDAVVVCNHGLSTGSGLDFPVDNILVYTLPSPTSAQNSQKGKEAGAGVYIPHLTVRGPSAFNAPWTRHAKPASFTPAQLERLCLRDIEPHPAVLACAPYLPTLPRLHTLQVGMFAHDEMPVVSAGTLPALHVLEVYRDVFGGTAGSVGGSGKVASRRTVAAVEQAVLRKLERLVLVGRAAESRLFNSWAADLEEGGTVFEQLRELTVGLLARSECGFVEKWRLPEKLERLEVVVWHREIVAAQPKKIEPEEGEGDEDEGEDEDEEVGDAKAVLEALSACLHRNRQSRSFKQLVVRVAGVLPRLAFAPTLAKLNELCNAHGITFEMHEEAGESILYL